VLNGQCWIPIGLIRRFRKPLDAGDLSNRPGDPKVARDSAILQRRFCRKDVRRESMPPTQHGRQYEAPHTNENARQSSLIRLPLGDIEVVPS
jgi:hypothetical protein